jgi:hypothetical protein
VGSDGVEPKEEPEPEPGPKPVRRKRKLFPYLLLGAGGLVAAYLAAKAPREQHVKLVLGPRAEAVTALEVQYVAEDGDVARDTRMTFEPGQAPRVVAHDPQLADGDYRLRIDVDTREGRRSVERRVTLGGGTTQVDLAALLTAP